MIMSRATKTKHVTKEVLEDLVEPTDTQEIVKVRVFMTSCGSHFVEKILLYRLKVVVAIIYTEL